MTRLVPVTQSQARPGFPTPFPESQRKCGAAIGSITRTCRPSSPRRGGVAPHSHDQCLMRHSHAVAGLLAREEALRVLWVGHPRQSFSRDRRRAGARRCGEEHLHSKRSWERRDPLWVARASRAPGDRRPRRRELLFSRESVAEKVRFGEDAEASTRDACATPSSALPRRLFRCAERAASACRRRGYRAVSPTLPRRARSALLSRLIPAPSSN